MRSWLIAVAFVSMSVSAFGVGADELPNPLYVYQDDISKYFIPSGYMGDHGDIKINQRFTGNPASGKTCLQVKYSTAASQGNNWAGVFWQRPANNWGDKRGGISLKGYKRMKFKVRGEKGGETIDKFGIGGITGQTQDGDTDEASVGPITLTKDWKEYEIDLAKADLSYMIGGFVWAANLDLNPDGFTMYLDDLKYEK